MAEEATPERPVGCLGLPSPLTAPTPRLLGPAKEPLAPAMDGPAGSAKPLDTPEHRERAITPSDSTSEAGSTPASDTPPYSTERGPQHPQTTPEAGQAPASDQITTRAQIGPRASSSTSRREGREGRKGNTPVAGPYTAT